MQSKKRCLRRAIRWETQTMTLRVATWNMQAVVPIRSEGKWSYLVESIAPDVALLTEAKPDRTSALRQVYREGGLGKYRRWGTIVASRPDIQLVERSQVEYQSLTYDLYQTFPGSVVACDVMRDDRHLVTVVAIYGMTVDPVNGDKVGYGFYSTVAIMQDLDPLFLSRGDRGLIVGGDLNILPDWTSDFLKSTPLVDLVERTASSRPPSNECPCESPKPCHHIWTHKNKANNSFQQVDFLFATPDIADRVTRVYGGPKAFPGIWDWSDHAPLVAEFRI